MRRRALVVASYLCSAGIILLVLSIPHWQDRVCAICAAFLALINISLKEERPRIAPTSNESQESRHPALAWFASNRTCRDCGFPIVVTQPNAETNPYDDYYWFCANQQCLGNHHVVGEHTGDLESPVWADLKKRGEPQCRR